MSGRREAEGGGRSQQTDVEQNSMKVPVLPVPGVSEQVPALGPQLLLSVGSRRGGAWVLQLGGTLESSQSMSTLQMQTESGEAHSGKSLELDSVVLAPKGPGRLPHRP